ncbi:MAG TPA: glutathione peroxidase [Polyangiaceae bacterium]|nr:glutathione peroxidase [Polyangiaceae bacterium]
MKFVGLSIAASVASVLCTLGCNQTPPPVKASERTAPMTTQSVYDFSLNTIDGAPLSLAQYKGKVLLIVNVASECGFTPQYQGLEQLHEKYAARGLVLMGVPANEFGHQEPGTNEEIKEFCSTKFHVTFPMFEKIVVKGEGQHPLYQWLTSNDKDSVSWNFNKFLIDRQGHLVKHFGARVTPMSAELTQAIEALL